MSIAPASLEHLLEAARLGRYTPVDDIVQAFEAGRLVGYAQGLAFAAAAVKAPAAPMEAV